MAEMPTTCLHPTVEYEGGTGCVCRDCGQHVVKNTEGQWVTPGQDRAAPTHTAPAAPGVTPGRRVSDLLPNAPRPAEEFDERGRPTAETLAWRRHTAPIFDLPPLPAPETDNATDAPLPDAPVKSYLLDGAKVNPATIAAWRRDPKSAELVQGEWPESTTPRKGVADPAIGDVSTDDG
jgi:hypothetical protein